MTLLHTFPSGETLWLRPAPAIPPPPPQPPAAAPERTFLLIAGELIDESGTDTVRLVKQPARTRTTPVISAADGNRNFQAAVLRDAATGTFRMWHGVWDGTDPATGYSIVRNVMRTSADGIAWSAPTLIPSLGAGAIANVVDFGPMVQQRYELITRSIGAPTPPGRWPGHRHHSADGINWTPSLNNPIVPEPCGEIYVLHPEGVLMRYNRAPWTDAAGVHVNSDHDPSFYRTIYQARLGTDGVHYGPAAPVFLPQFGEGETQFYSVSNVIRRGETRLCALNILRDDLTAAGVAAPAYGTGYSVLAWSLDGAAWDRHRGTDPHYLDPAPLGAWDHAISWITSLVEVGDKVYVYYGGYAQGHKTYTDRGIGLCVIDRDRFVARASIDATPRTLRTKPLALGASRLTVNARGRVRLRALDSASGQPVPGYGYADALSFPLAGGLAMPWLPAGTVPALGVRPVKLEFEITAGELYAFTLA